MSSSRALAPLVAATLGLVGALGATLSLHRGASRALDEVQEERLRGAGESVALLFADTPPSDARMKALLAANGLDGAYVLSADLKIVADAEGGDGLRADLLRVDASRVRQAFLGASSVATPYELGSLPVAAGYFPVRGPDGAVTAVVGLEAGRSFQAARSELQGALSLGLGLSLLGGLALAVVAARWTAAERQRREAAERAARGEVMAQMAAIAAHEIRNPLGVIRGTVELMRERAGPVLSDRDRSSLEDVLGEVERLRRLTEDFMDLSADRPLALAPVDLRQVLLEAASSTETLFPAVQVEVGLATTQLVVRGDAGRLRQVFANLLTNAAQAQGQGRLGLVLLEAPQRLRVEIRDTGPGLADEVRARLFDPFVSGKAGGTGLGLTLSRRLVERHGGTLTLESFTGKGTVARVDLPASQVG